ncbi:hypothetical protein H5410_041675 [Solanum commersonii]|uniref:Uncharacterized protein n=1 Tax=Solanum commersonii TaxID=4109 RepID=A0A9J5XSJ6_SOLCO|nr:hypothetical protein H5410_041675 [Solanum commersonii]
MVKDNTFKYMCLVSLGVRKLYRGSDTALLEEYNSTNSQKKCKKWIKEALNESWASKPIVQLAQEPDLPSINSCQWNDNRLLITQVPQEKSLENLTNRIISSPAHTGLTARITS